MKKKFKVIAGDDGKVIIIDENNNETEIDDKNLADRLMGSNKEKE